MHRLQGLKAIICDWSGVVSDDRRLAYGANVLVLEHYGFPTPTFEEWLDTMDWPDPVSFFASRGLHLDPATAYAHYAPFCEQVRANGGEPVVYAAAQRFLAEASRGRRIAVVSKHPQAAIELEASLYGIAETLHAIHGAVADKATAIIRTLEAFDIAPSDAAYIGDMRQDIHAARKADVLSVAVAYGYQKREKLAEEQPDILVDCLSELIPHV